MATKLTKAIATRLSMDDYLRVKEEAEKFNLAISEYLIMKLNLTENIGLGEAITSDNIDEKLINLSKKIDSIKKEFQKEKTNYIKQINQYRDKVKQYEDRIKELSMDINNKE